MNNNALEGSGISFRFGPKALLNGVSIRVPNRAIVGIIGPSGSGKSSLGKVLCGLLVPTEGNVSIGSQEAVSVCGKAPVMVWQEPCLFEHLPVRDNIALGLTVRGVKEAKKLPIVEKLTRKFRLNSIEATDVRFLSGGERARVALARALAVNPEVLVLDEPFASLDMRSRGHAIDAIMEFVSGPKNAVILISHSRDDILSLCSQVLVLDTATPNQQVSVQSLINKPRSGFEAQFTGRWGVLAARVENSTSTGFRCSTTHGAIDISFAPWIVDHNLAPNTPVSVIFDPSNVKISKSNEGLVARCLFVSSDLPKKVAVSLSGSSSIEVDVPPDVFVSPAMEIRIILEKAFLIPEFSS